MKNPETPQNSDAQNNYIPNIHKYCDLWCTKCPFSDRCGRHRIYKHISPGGTPDFLNQIRENVQKLQEEINDITSKQGMKPGNQPIDEIAERKEQEKKAYSKNHILTKTAKKYMVMAMGWFANNHKLIMKSGYQLLQNIKLGIRGEETEEEATAVYDAFELIGWYCNHIRVRLEEAISGEYEFKKLPEKMNKPTEADGQAKAALIEMDRSLAAWNKLQNYFPDAGDDILDVQIFLDNLKKDTEKHFPQARDFVRPGFDEIRQD
ncbi:MAG: hypothetical protein ACLFM7_06365 [Bacteroidales bacterium]